ncbi:hypothetical protein ACFFG9_47445, partial [Kutzneria buriramensis]|uniref:hypothetical protein n=1 Tax=Kutzneria buriramensis TaxID=1045776 RepID=UPI0035EC4C58
MLTAHYGANSESDAAASVRQPSKMLGLPSSASLSRVNLLMLTAVRAVDHVVKLDQVERLREELES